MLKTKKNLKEIKKHKPKKTTKASQKKLKGGGDMF